MANLSTNPGGRRAGATNESAIGYVSPEHYLRLIWHRKWLVVGTFLLITVLTAVISSRLPNVYTSSTLILVDPQKVPDSYVKATVSGDVRNRLGTLRQQILSATRLQKIIDALNLYSAERKSLAREDIITKMSKDIYINVVSDFGGSQDLQAFRVTYSGNEPRLVAQVTNELATLFIDENLKAREQQASGTTEFLQNQLQETRKNLEQQEGKLRDFRLKHIGEMPEQQNADLQILGQIQSQLQLEGEALGRAEQQKSYLQSMMSQTAPVVDLDESDPKSVTGAAAENKAGTAGPSAPSKLAGLRARLTVLQGRYGEAHPDIRKLKQEIADEEANQGAAVGASAAIAPATVAAAAPIESAPVVPRPRKAAPAQYANPVLQSQLKTVEDEIAKHKQEQQRLNKLAVGYQAKLEVIPVREQEIATLVRDYEISKAHYGQLLNNQLSAETATQLEIRQKGEKFTVLDPAQPAEKPTSPNRALINTGGAVGGLMLGLLLALVTEFLGMCITTPEQVTDATGFAVLEIIPVIRTHADVRLRKRRLVWGTASGVAVTILAVGAALFYHYRS
jgi:polysaccharide chain length determinant protein (PEP-CTERM system associated)